MFKIREFEVNYTIAPNYLCIYLVDVGNGK